MCLQIQNFDFFLSHYFNSNRLHSHSYVSLFSRASIKIYMIQKFSKKAKKFTRKYLIFLFKRENFTFLSVMESPMNPKPGSISACGWNFLLLLQSFGSFGHGRKDREKYELAVIFGTWTPKYPNWPADQTLSVRWAFRK